MRGAWSDHSAESPEPTDPARGVRRLLGALLLLALVAAAGALALSQRRAGSSAPGVPALFPVRFSEPGFSRGDAVLVSSYDAAANSRRTTASITLRGTVYVVTLCGSGTVRVEIEGLTSAAECTGKVNGVIAVHLTRPTRLIASVNAAQPHRWGVAIYR